MAMNVLDTRTVTTGTPWRYVLSCDPKMPGLLQLSFFNGASEIHREYWTDRKEATKAAILWMQAKWMDALSAAPVATDATEDEDDECDDDGELDPERGTFVDRYGRPYEDRYEAFEGHHLSSHPAQCGCGDCLTYMAGEQG